MLKKALNWVRNSKSPHGVTWWKWWVAATAVQFVADLFWPGSSFWGGFLRDFVLAGLTYFAFLPFSQKGTSQ